MSDLLTNQCPNCGQSLPPSAMRCQFCNADFVDSRPAAKPRMLNVSYDTKAKAWYVVCCIFWIVTDLVAAFGLLAMAGAVSGGVDQPQMRAAEAAGSAEIVSAVSWVLFLIVCFCIVVAGSMLTGSRWARRYGMVLTWVGTVIIGLSALFEAFNIFTSATPTGYGSLALDIVSFVMTFVTRYAIANTDAR
jgi:hypothetical protein